MRALRRLPCPGALASMLALAAPIPAPAAQRDLPHVDPHSPAGTEYQLPTDRAREQAGGGAGATGSTGGSAPLFGAGVPAKTAGGSGATTGSGTQSRSGAKAGARPKSGAGREPATVAGAKPDAATHAPETIRAQAPAPDGGGSGLVAVGGGAAGVLLIGGLAGLAWRRRAVGR